ncbi:MAG: transposase [Geobacter sp.]|nr:transposase [Geobacter sp.]MSM41382.1 transposase [Geobacter sp.]
MARISRIVVPGYPHHVTQRGVRSMDVFHSDEDRRAYLAFLSEEAARFNVEILSWCLMTNHVHFIAVPNSETSLARGFGEAHRRYTRMKNFSQGVRGYLFQGRFSSCVLDQRHLLAAARYVALNPVVAGMVETPWEYPWSSTRYHCGLSDHDPLVKDRTLLGLVTDWREFLSCKASTEPDRLQQSIRTGRPAGDEQFIAAIENLTGRELKIKPAGRPSKSA